MHVASWNNSVFCDNNSDSISVLQVDSLLLIAGPCAAETKEQVLETAKRMAASGIAVFRAGVWKPRTMPGSFEGAGEQALEWLTEARTITGLPLATEVSSATHVKLALDFGVDYLWIGARTTTNPFLVQEIADAIKSHPRKPKGLMVKNPISPDVKLWAGAIERLQQTETETIIAVHRGFQTGQPTELRNAPCWSVAFALKNIFPKIKLVLDPSHMAGKKELIAPLVKQAVALGYDGLMIESHIHPETALSDADQQLTPEELALLLGEIKTRNLSATDVLLPYRKQIDEIDDTIFSLLKKRMEVSRQIGAIKKTESMPVFQEDRFSALLKRRLQWAAENGLSEDTVEAIMNAIHEESCRQQI